MKPIVVCSFWVHRPEDFPGAADYPAMLELLDRSCRRFGYEHIVLTDIITEPLVTARGLRAFATTLPRNLLQATTRSQANWMASPRSWSVDTVFVGADCLVIRDFRGELEADLSIVFMPDHKRWRMMNGFMYVPAESRDQVTPFFRNVADDTRALPAKTCDDMAALERALAPMPASYGVQHRAGMTVDFLEEAVWNGRPKTADEPCERSYVLHFRGGDRKPVFFEWAARWLPDLAA